MNKYKGFTLVELMIVLVVIGVLSIMIMFSSSEAVDSANATKIINNLGAFQRAGLAYYNDNMDTINKDPSKYKPDLDGEGRTILKYFDKSLADDSQALKKRADELKKEGYAFKWGFNSSKRQTRWYITYTFKKDENGVKNKFAGRAKSLKLLGYVDEKSYAPDTLGDTEEPSSSLLYDGTQETVYLRIR